MSIMRLRKTRPGMTTVAAWLRVPMRDCSCLLVAVFLPLHSRTVAEMRASLSGWRLSSILLVSIWMPRNVSWQLGPSVLCVATGTPSSRHVSKVHCSTWAQVDVPGGPNSRKVIQVVKLVGNPPRLQNPCQGIRHSRKYLRGGSEAEGEGCVDKHLITPADTQQPVVVRVDGNHAVGVMEVKLGQLRTDPKLLNDLGCLPDRRVSHVAPVWSNGVIDTAPCGGGQVHY